MYILNHSCKVERPVLNAFIRWINEYYGEKDKNGNHLHDYRYSKLCAPLEDDDSVIIIIQVFIDEIREVLDLYLTEQQEIFQTRVYQAFQNRVLSFLTLMEVLRKHD